MGQLVIESLRKRHERWRLPELLVKYPMLRIVPSIGDELVLAGRLPVCATGPDGRLVEDEYRVKVQVPDDFPKSLALVRETEGRIPRRFHKLTQDHLCLGTPTEQRLVLAESPTLTHFVLHLVIPYLYGYSYFVTYGEMPFGEERHGDQGLRDHLGRLYHAPAIEGVEDFLRLTGLRKRVANKQSCPCRSGIRLGKCHNRVVNALRKKLGRLWFRAEYESVMLLLDKPSASRRSALAKSATLHETLSGAAGRAPSLSSDAVRVKGGSDAGERSDAMQLFAHAALPS